jgi:hypothetical protein
MDFERGSRRCCIGPVAVSSPPPSVDAGYRVEDKGKDWVQKALGWTVDLVRRARKAAPEEILKSWAAEWAKRAWP